MALREEILETCFVPYNSRFARGQRANNKLDMDRLKRNSELREQVVVALAELVEKHEPDFIVGVPRGGTWLAEDIYGIADIKSLAHLVTRNTNKGHKRTAYQDDFIDRQQIVGNHRQGVLVEDLLNWYTSTRRSLAVPSLGPKIVAVVAVWDRGPLHPRGELDVPFEALITEHIPEMLPEDSDLYQGYLV